MIKWSIKCKKYPKTVFLYGLPDKPKLRITDGDDPDRGRGGGGGGGIGINSTVEKRHNNLA